METCYMPATEAATGSNPDSTTNITTSTNNHNSGSISIGHISIPTTTSGPRKVTQLPVDDVLEKDEGLIKRPLTKFCRHGAKGMCEFCSPLPPWDANYRKENAIKHMSYHAYLKELNELKNSKHNSSSMVDHVEFATSSIMNNFIDVWRHTGVQRFGVMYGRYEPFDKLDGITMLPWENEAEDSYFLSNLEILMAARNQIQHANITKFSSSGQFSSKFVTCVISGGLNGEIEPRSYQVSTSAEALVRADIITGSTQPSRLYVNSSNDRRYVPDVAYSELNEYGLEVKSNAKPTFPVDFLLVSLTDSFPVNPTPMFDTDSNFVIENRDFFNELQNLHAVSKYLNADTSGKGTSLCNFHFLVYLKRTNILGAQEFDLLLRFVRGKTVRRLFAFGGESWSDDVDHDLGTEHVEKLWIENGFIDSSSLPAPETEELTSLSTRVSNRNTPSLVGFGPKNRFIGESGKNQQTSNLKNTVDNIKRILGANFNDPDFEIEKKYFTCPLVESKDGGISAKVRFLGEQQEFTATQLAAMYIDKIKDITIKETKANITDISLSVPVWYTEKQRRAAADACRIAGLNPVRIVNEVTAAAVGYGVFKANDLPEDEPKKVAFVDIGHSSYQVSIAAVKKGELKILASAYDKHFGGRDFDYAIASHFADEFVGKYKIDVRENPKAFYRILTAAEKLKKVLSANTQAPFNIESVMNDVDVSSSLTREELEEFVQPLLARVHEAGLTTDDIDSIEVIGGCTRVPSLKNKLKDIFGKELSFTLNQDEAIARVRPFKFEDYNPYSVSYFWAKEEEDEDHMEVFPRGGSFPSTKIITLFRKGDFEVEAKYTKPEELPVGTSPLVAKWEIKGVVPSEGETSIATKIKLRNDPSGFYTIEAAYTVEEKIVKELVEKEPKEGEEQDDEDSEPEYREVKKLVKKADLEVITHSASLEPSVREEFIEKENALVMGDKLVADTEDRKNALEEYIYDLRGKLDDKYKDFASDAEKEQLTALLSKTEDWLYDEGYDSTKAKYIAKYEELASKGNLIKGRYLQKEEEKKQAYRQKQEAAQAAAMAEKLAAARDASKAEQKPAPEEADVDMD
ncbi:hypothetical protein G9P44_005510 [Scheffersomyces stipitis]|nr:hypothetical protein G9P44_005510 [Scheffersomyces stipitis]